MYNSLPTLLHVRRKKRIHDFGNLSADPTILLTLQTLLLLLSTLNT
jgi:hypothetical protein